jgi:hypothetical protein
LGGIWIGLLLMFIMFFFKYQKYYKLGVIQKNKSYYLSL